MRTRPRQMQFEVALKPLQPNGDGQHPETTRKVQKGSRSDQYDQLCNA